jgi:RNA polymerase sigma factor (sigma-70 family)
LYNSDTTKEIVALLLQKNKDGFAIVYDKYAPTLNGILLKLLNGNETIAEQILQDSFIKIWNTIDEYEAQAGSLFTWMLSITRDHANNYLRSQPNNETQNSDENITDTAPLQESMQKLGAINETLLATLEQKYITVLDLLYFKGMKYEDAARKLDLPVAIVKTRMQFAIQQLRNTL